MGGTVLGLSTVPVAQAAWSDTDDFDPAAKETLAEKYGKQEAAIIVDGIEAGLEPEEILTDPRLERARRDYLEYQYSKPEADRDVDRQVLDAASDDVVSSVRESDELELLASSPDLENPCHPYASTAGTLSSDPHTFSTFSFRHVQSNDYGVASAEYSSECSYAMLERMNALADAQLYGAASVTLRHLGAQLSDDFDLGGTQTVSVEFDAAGVAPGGYAELGIVLLSDQTNTFQTEYVETIDAAFDGRISGQTQFDLSVGDMIGAELRVSADGTGGAATADFLSADRGATPTIRLYE